MCDLKRYNDSYCLRPGLTFLTYQIAIKSPAPQHYEKTWGDYYFALGLKKSLEKQGHHVRIDSHEKWYSPSAEADEIVIALRGLYAYEPKPHQLNILWLISHPELIQTTELTNYSHIFVASKDYCNSLKERTKTPVTTLLQCTDPEVFYPDTSRRDIPREPLLYVGSTRKRFRRAVEYALQADFYFSVYGIGWKELLPPQYFKGNYIYNEELHAYYSRCDILMVDHWPDMVNYGFVANRIFDAAACKAFMVSDYVHGMESITEDTVPIYRSPREFKAQVNHYLAHPELRREKTERLYQLVSENHTFDHRTPVILDVIDSIYNT